MVEQLVGENEIDYHLSAQNYIYYYEFCLFDHII